MSLRYVSEEDLEFFKDHVERNVQLEGASKWEKQMDKDFSTFNYAAWRRILPVSRHLEGWPAWRGLRVWGRQLRLQIIG